MCNKDYLIFLGFVLAIFISFGLISNLNIVVGAAADCWQYNETNNATCIASNGCIWQVSDWGSYCTQLDCWSLNTQTLCTSTNVPEKNCTWNGGTTTYGCTMASCWNFQDYGSSGCVNNTHNMSCTWDEQCWNNGYSGGGGVDCNSIATSSNCTNTVGCSWGMCKSQSCEDISNLTACNSTLDWEGRNCSTIDGSCTYNSCWRYYNSSDCNLATGINCVWKYSSCQNVQCYNWDFTNETACVNNSKGLTCSWTGSYCNTAGCWNQNSNATCSGMAGCVWTGYTGGSYCEELSCWNWDSWRGYNESNCLGNSSLYGLGCVWQNASWVDDGSEGWCYKDMSSTTCSNYSTATDCMDSYYCWWQYNDPSNPDSLAGSCNEPTGGWGTDTNDSMMNDWNPGCYIFDTNQSDCDNVVGCNYTNITNDCYAVNITGWVNSSDIVNNGINCSLINSSNLCNKIPMLSTCCIWNNGSCSPNKVSTSCWDQMEAPPAGADFCEDYNAFTDKVLCDQIAGYPWYMPCKWSNATDRCGFNAADVFGGNESQSLIKIENKKNCEAAGGKWIVENYCEGSVSVPTGRCEYKFDDEDNCDKSCFACEIKTSSGGVVNATNAESTCLESALGYCVYTSSTNAPNGIGYCEANSEYSSGVATDCNTDCGACTYLGDADNNDTTKRPSYFCLNSNSNSVGGGCKWITDNSTTTGGYCLNKGEKTCEDSCDRCSSQKKCSDDGRTNIANQSGSCKWQGSENDGSCVDNTGSDVEICWNGEDDNSDNLIDCADASCYTDSYCGFVEGDCFGWTSNTSCINAGCEWVIDKWGSWCDFKGSQCWKNNQNVSSCSGILIISNETLDITAARLLEGNEINESVSFGLGNLGGGWVNGSVLITNITGGNLTMNVTIDYAAYTITFGNDSQMITGNGSANFTKVSYQYYASVASTNCEWSNGSGYSWCEQDWSKTEICMGLNVSDCWDNSGSGCGWTNDSWCSSTGNGTDWCTNSGGWCDHSDFKPKNCWQNQSNSNECGNVSGCSWKTDSYSQPHCEVNWSGSCWEYNDGTSCGNAAGCNWTVDDWGSYCSYDVDRCWRANTESACNGTTSSSGVRLCSWFSGSEMCQPTCFNSSNSVDATGCSSSQGCYWADEMGWCEEVGLNSCSNNSNMNNETNCITIDGCRWKSDGWCDPKGGVFSTGAAIGGGGMGGAMGGDCYKYDGNQTLCTNKTITNLSCGWTSEFNPRCEVDWGTDCWGYVNETSCVEGSSNTCWWYNDSHSGGTGTYGWCVNVMDQCWQNGTLQGDASACNNNTYCNATTWNTCEPTCFSTESSGVESNCLTGCKWITGYCNPGGMNDMFDDMETGAPMPLGTDLCGDGAVTPSQSSIDINGFGVKDMGDSYGFGISVCDFSNASICNKVKLSSFVMGMAESGGEYGGGFEGNSSGGGFSMGTERTGDGNDTVKFFIYLDTDGSTTEGCTLTHNSSAAGYEFRFKYVSEWNATKAKAVETFNAYKCDNSKWKATDIKLSAWNKIMCSDIGGGMLAVEKSDLARFPSLYSSTSDIRVFVATAGPSTNLSSPYDKISQAGWTTPGSVDFEINDMFAYGADSAKYENAMKQGFVQYEDCYNGIDDDNDGNLDCADWDCEYSSNCTSGGINAAGYSDTTSPKVTGVKIEEYPDSALIMYDTSKPTNGSLLFYGNDSQCLTINKTVYDVGILLNSSVRMYKMWHYGPLYNDSTSLGFALNNKTKYYYKLKVCDSAGRCAVSKCSSFQTTTTSRCGFCNFVTRIKAPSGWNVYYDTDQDNTYEHFQGYVCGANAGMKTNYTLGRKVNIKLNKSDGSAYFEFINATLTKSSLNDKVRTISGSGDILYDSTERYMGLTSETRDKVINNLHPEVCRVKIQYSGTCDSLFHCDDTGLNCVDRTAAATLVDATNCVWEVPYCEFSTYRESETSSSSSGGGTSSGGSSGGGGGGGAAASTTTSTDEDDSTTTSSSTSSGGGGDDGSVGDSEGIGVGGDEEEGGISPIIMIIVGVGIAGVIVVVYFFMRKRK